MKPELSPPEIWERFMKTLAKEEPLGKNGEIKPHVSMLGSVETYRKIFLKSFDTKE